MNKRSSVSLRNSVSIKGDPQGLEVSAGCNGRHLLKAESNTRGGGSRRKVLEQGDRGTGPGKMRSWPCFTRTCMGVSVVCAHVCWGGEGVLLVDSKLS